MSPKLRLWLALASLVVFAGCSGRDPGPLAGNWRMSGALPMNVQFRSGETEALGIIDKVSYDVKGNVVIVTYESGVMKGSSVRYAVTGKDTVRTELGTLQRIK